MKEKPIQDASFELVSRIMKFVDYKLDKISPATLAFAVFNSSWGAVQISKRLILPNVPVPQVTFDSSLISMTLQTELYVSQRGQYMELLPICNLTKALGGPLWPLVAMLPTFFTHQVLYPETFAYICAKLQKQVFETKERCKWLRAKMRNDHVSNHLTQPVMLNVGKWVRIKKTQYWLVVLSKLLMFRFGMTTIFFNWQPPTNIVLSLFV